MTIRLNLGCGPDIRPGWTNIDAHPMHPGITPGNVTRLDIPPGTVDEILASDILEHMPLLEWPRVLAHWVGLLKPGGRITVQCPDMEALSRRVLEAAAMADHVALDECMRRIFGGQNGPGMAHLCGFSGGRLSRALAECGCEVVDVSRHNWNVTVVGVMP